MAWYFPMHSVISQYLPFCSNRVRTWYITSTVVSCPKINFSASCKMSRAAATTQIHDGYPFVIWSNLFERFSVSCGVFPRVWDSNSSPIPFLQWTYNLKSFCKLGNPNAGAETRFSFKVSNATWQSSVHLKGSECRHFKELYNSFAIITKFGIQIQQNHIIS